MATPRTADFEARSDTIPVTPNQRAVVYHGGGPPAPPDVPSTKILLTAEGNYPRRQETGEDEADALRYTHTAIVPATMDVRDNKSAAYAAGSGDTVYVPDQNGTPFKVSHVELCNRGLSTMYKKVYLDRGTPPWPTNDL